MGYVFKFNLGATLLSDYESELEYKQLLENVIPMQISLVFDLKNETKNLYKFNFDDKQRELNELEQRFNELEELTIKLEKLYNEALDHFEDTGETVYSKEFHSLTTTCGRKRQALIWDFPRLRKSEEYDDNFIQSKYQIRYEYKVQKGIEHLRKFYKLKEYIEETSFNSIVKTPNTYYYAKNEWIIIGGNDLHDAQVHANWIAENLNKNETLKGHIGLVEIVPIYQKFELKKSINKIEYTVVYPNGLSKERDDFFRAEQELEAASGDKLTTVIESDNKLSNEYLNKRLSVAASMGYLKNLIVNGNQFASEIISKVKTVTITKLKKDDADD